MTNILIISELGDAHIPFVTKHFPASVKYTIIDPFASIGQDNVTYDFHNGKLHLSYGDTPIDAIDSVWFRKPTKLDAAKLGTSDMYQGYATGAIRRHISPLYRHWKDAFWVSQYENLLQAEQKPHQLDAAAKIGFNVPDTLITGDSKKARQFVEKYDTCIIKNQAIEFPLGKAMMTTVISANDAISYEGLSIDPMIFQQLIDPAYELRVTVVGDEVFAAKIISADRGPFRDWRYGHIDNTFTAEATVIDDGLRKKCLQLTRHFDLHYGAIDLIVDKEGTVWFLEINPNGQWAFIEEATGQPIGKAMAKLLCSSMATR